MGEPLAVAGLEAGAQEVVADDGAVLPGGGLEAAFGFVEDLDAQGEPAGDGHRLVELEGLARAVRDDDGDGRMVIIIVVVRRRETDGEVPGRAEFQWPFGEGLAVGFDRVAGRGRAEVVAGIALDGAPDQDLVSGEVEAVVGLPGQVEGGQDELVRPHGGGSDLLAVLADVDGVHAAALALAEHEGAGGGTELARREVGLCDLLVRGVGERGVQPDAGGAGGEGVGALVEQDLELHGLVRIVGAAVRQDHRVVPGGIVRADGLPRFEAEAVALGFQHPAVPACDRLEGVAPAVLLQRGGEALRQVGESVDGEVLDRVDLPALAVQQQDVAALYGLAGDVVGHVHAVAAEIALVGDGQGVLVVFALGFGLALGALQGIGAVVEGGHLEGQGVRDVEAPARIGDQAVIDLLLALEEADAYLRKVAHGERGDAPLDARRDLLPVQLPEDVVDGGAALGDGLLLAGEALAVGDEALAVVRERAVLRGSALRVAQVVVALQQQRFARQQGDRLAGVFLRIGFVERARLLSGTAPGDVAEFDEGVERIAAVEPVGEFAGRVGVAASEQAPERVFVVVGDPGQQGGGVSVAGQVAVPLIELRVVCRFHPGLVGPDVGQERAGVRPVAPVVEDGHGLAEAVQVAFGFLVELLAELPVGAGAGLDILPRGIVEVPGEVLLRSFLLDPEQDVGLVLGLVGVHGLVVFGPEPDEGVSLVILRGGG